MIFSEALETFKKRQEILEKKYSRSLSLNYKLWIALSFMFFSIRGSKHAKKKWRKNILRKIERKFFFTASCDLQVICSFWIEQLEQNFVSKKKFGWNLQGLDEISLLCEEFKDWEFLDQVGKQTKIFFKKSKKILRGGFLGELLFLWNSQLLTSLGTKNFSKRSIMNKKLSHRKSSIFLFEEWIDFWLLFIDTFLILAWNIQKMVISFSFRLRVECLFSDFSALNVLIVGFLCREFLEPAWRK